MIFLKCYKSTPFPGFRYFTPVYMINKKLTSLLFCVLLFCKLSAQTTKSYDYSFYKNRVSKAPGSVFKKFTDAGMQPTDHVLTEAESAKLDKAFSILPPLHKKILKEHLHSISFMDNMPNTALTSTVETADSTQQFNITFRAGILNETISEWATWKEKSAFDNSATPAIEIQIDAGNLDAIQYVLLHEATHVIDAVLQLTPNAAKADSLAVPTSLTKNIWHLFNSPVAKYSNPLLEKTRFRTGTIQPISSAAAIYNALKKTPFPSLYGMAAWSEDIAELISIYHLTNKLNQPFIIYLKENDSITAVFEPMKNKLVKKRFRQLRFFYD